jgi:hypothetical protein
MTNLEYILVGLLVAAVFVASVIVYVCQHG